MLPTILRLYELALAVAALARTGCPVLAEDHICNRRLGHRHAATAVTKVDLLTGSEGVRLAMLAGMRGREVAGTFAPSTKAEHAVVKAIRASAREA